MATLPQYKTDSVSTSNFDLSHRLRTTMTSGIVYPALVHYTLPGEKVKLGIASSLKTLQTLAPVLGSCAVQYEIYFSRLSDYVDAMAENEIGWSDAELPLPAFSIVPEYLYHNQVSEQEILSNQVVIKVSNSADSVIDYQTSFNPYNTSSNGLSYELGVISPSSLWSFLDLGSGYARSSVDLYSDYSDNRLETFDFAGLSFLQYIDIIRNYFANPQENNIPCFGIGRHLNTLTANKAVDTVDGRPNCYVTLNDLDNFFKEFRRQYNAGDPDVIKAWGRTLGKVDDAQSDPEVAPFYGLAADEWYDHFSGLFCATHFADMFNGRLNSTKVDEFVKQAKVQVTDGSFTVDTLRFANRLSRVLNLSLFSGGRFDDWQRALWSVKPNSHLRIPQFIGSFTQDISFDEIVSLSGSETGTSSNGQGLGAVAGRMDDYQRSQYHYFEADTYGCLMVVVTIIPRIGYSNNCSRHAIKTNLNDWYLPQYDRLGFQDVFKCETSMLPDISFTKAGSGNTTTYNFTGGAMDTTAREVSIGKQPAWIEYMTATDRIKGEFASETGLLSYWTIQPDYDTYIISDVESVKTPVPLNGLLGYMQSHEPIDVNRLSHTYDFSSYINPAAFNHLFPDQSRGAENFYLQTAFDLQVNIEKSKNALPKL